MCLCYADHYTRLRFLAFILFRDFVGISRYCKNGRYIEYQRENIFTFEKLLKGGPHYHFVNRLKQNLGSELEKKLWKRRKPDYA